MKNEIKTLEKNQTWDLVILPQKNLLLVVSGYTE
jgi:hypothetical protein